MTPSVAAATAVPRRGVPLIDGVEKVTGRAAYTADLDHADALVGRIFRSPVSHGEIVRLDIANARALDGVVAVLTGEDCSHSYGVLPVAMNEYPLARGRVRYRGEPVAAVAAIDAATAQRALDLIEFEVRELPAYYSSAAARAADAMPLHDNKPGNLEREVHHAFGDVAAGFARADLVREDRISCAEVNHAQIEPHAALAEYEPFTQRLTMQSVTQVAYYLHLMLARCLDMDTSRIRVIKPFVGGGFGARVEVLNFEIITALLARAAAGKVMMQLTREENFLTHRARPQTDVRLKLGMCRDGRITACECEVTQRGGAYAGYGIVTILYAGALLQGLYDIPAIKYDGYRVYANLPPCGAMRGHGAVDTRHAFECLLDRMARQLGLDPFAVRRANLLQAPTRTMNDLMVNSYGLPECLDTVEQASGWRERIGNLPPGKGLGMACSHYVSGAAKPIHWTGEPHAAINLKLDFDGSITAFTGAADIGQGSSTMVAIAVAETLERRARTRARGGGRQRDYAEGQWRLFLAHHVHGGKRGDRCGEKPAKDLDRGGRQKAGSGARGYRMLRRAIPRRQRRASGPAVRRCGASSPGRCRCDHRERNFHLSAGSPRRPAPGRGGRLDHGFQLRGPGGRGQRRGGDGGYYRGQGLGRPGLRSRH